MRRPKVLLVDDEPAILQSTGMLLQALGYDVVTVRRAEEILPAARREHPDLLLQDVRMPGLDLATLMRELRADPALAKVPVVLFSAGMDLDEVADRVGATSRLDKPFRLAELARAIETALA